VYPLVAIQTEEYLIEKMMTGVKHNCINLISFAGFGTGILTYIILWLRAVMKRKSDWKERRTVISTVGI
jgi:hypothetical protein